MLIRIIYTLLLAFVSPFLLFGLYKSKPNKPKFGARWKEHFGITPKLKNTHKPIWIHAVSVGESIAAVPLIKALKAKNPDQPILVTTTTSTGAEQIKKLGELVEHRYMPIDFGFAIKGFLKALKPKQLLIIETELWPNTLHLVHQTGIPITVVNARLSDKSYQNYAKIQWLFNLLHPCLDKVLCQNTSDAERFARLGVSQEKLVVVGSMKFDIDISDGVKKKGKALRDKLGSNRPVWIAASTHEGKDVQILQAHKIVLETTPSALLLLVPRHPERFDSVFDLCHKEGFITARRTSNQNVANNTQVYLGDTMGEMLILIGAADVCFMGGSLLGDKIGGHNVLEPAALGIPIIIGPSYFNFKEIVDALIEEQLIDICLDTNSLADKICAVTSNKTGDQNKNAKLIEFIQKKNGCIKRTMEIIREL